MSPKYKECQSRSRRGVHTQPWSFQRWNSYAERWPFGVLEMPPHVATSVAVEPPEITDVVVVRGTGTVVPTVRLTWILQVLASAAAVLVVPVPLIDRVAKALVRDVGQRGHPSPQEEGRAN